jgi:hypothetical protein
MRYDGPPEELLERCAEKIEREAHPKEQDDLLVVSRVLAELRFPDPDLLGLLGGQQTMIESPMLQRIRAENSQETLLEVLKGRFGTVPRDVTKLLRTILDEKKLKKLARLAGNCPDMEGFREALLE